ncbi:MAG: hypothetical protein A3F16_01445 [Deltaproteobacteria bacterium RIFCSPHIGHO2_12_FULL_43_9]|nr:MAG: hypothetical protein A3F16_01445 [Deltaproteobacteria bacterium RIFCSPHIGHO2_12_FULL_43_9]
MKSKTLKNISASVRERLLNISRTRKEDFQLILSRYAAERFLYRLSQSQYKETFILKGALLFLVWDPTTYRPTRDVDFLGKEENSISKLKNIFEEICQCSVDTDGVDFLASSVKAQKIKGDQEYEGIRITLVAKLSEAKIPLQIDIGFGDVVSPPPQLITFPTLLKFDPPKIKIYPKETVIAEKLHAIVNLGITNSRMKDFYDIWMLSKHFQFSGKELSNAIKQTFTRRKTPIPINPPLAFTAEFYNDKTKQTQWNAFVKKNQLIEGEGITLHETITQIINFLMPLIESIIQKEHFTLNWREGKWGK